MVRYIDGHAFNVNLYNGEISILEYISNAERFSEKYQTINILLIFVIIGHIRDLQKNV